MSLSEYPLTPPVSATPELISREMWQEEIVTRRQVNGEFFANLQEPLTVNTIKDVSTAYDTLLQMIIRSFDPKEAAEMMAHIAAIKHEAVVDTAEGVAGYGLPTQTQGPDSKLDPRKIVLANPGVQEIVRMRDMETAQGNLVDAWPQFKETYVTGVARGVDLGYIPPHVVKRTESALKKTSVRIANSALLEVLDTDDSVNTIPMTAYYDSEEDEICISDTVGNERKKLLSNLGHEFTHQISGGTFMASKTTPHGLVRSRAGFATEMKSGSILKNGLDEAMTQHVIQGIVTGDFETIDPHFRQDGDATYYHYRTVLAAFVRSSQGLIDMKTVTHAYFEDTEVEGGTQARRKFIGQASEAYGPGALNKLEKVMSVMTGVARHRVGSVIGTHIVPPILTPWGSIAVRGVIEPSHPAGRSSIAAL